VWATSVLDGHTLAKKPVTEPPEQLPGLESQEARYHRGGSYVTPEGWFDWDSTSDREEAGG
jgi:hypothetical protein